MSRIEILRTIKDNFMRSEIAIKGTTRLPLLEGGGFTMKQDAEIAKVDGPVV